MTSQLTLFTLSGSLIGLLWIGYRVFERRKHANKVDPRIHQSSSNGDPTLSSEAVHLLKILSFEKENLSLEDAYSMNKLLQSTNTDIQSGCISMLQQASSFSNNFLVMLDSGCLHTLLGLLSTDEKIILKNQNLSILQVSCNIVTDASCLEIVRPHIPMIISMANKLDYSDESCAALQLLANIALTSNGCRLLDNNIHVLIQLLSGHDAHMLRQVLTLFVNLSCDDASINVLLRSPVPEKLSTFKDCLSFVDQPVVTLKSIHLLKNLYAAIRRNTSGIIPDIYMETEQPLLHFLLLSIPDIKKHLELIPLELIMSDLASDIKTQSDKLHGVLNKFE